MSASNMKDCSSTLAAALLLVCLCTSSPSLARADASDTAPVEVTLYGESLCPFCIKVTAQTVTLLFKQGLQSIFNFTYVAYGNALNTSEGPVCQHGPAECLWNRVINCAQELSPDQDTWFPYVSCLEERLTGEFQKDEAAAKQCANETSLSYDDIKECTNGDLGDRLEAKAQAATDALHPAHSYVPWVVVNGVPLGADYGALKSIVCAAYAGERPEACFGVPPTVGVVGSSRGKLGWHDRRQAALA